MREREALLEENRELRKLVYASAMALRSYQFGNGSTELAGSIADDLAGWLAAHGETVDGMAPVDATVVPALVSRPFVVPAVMTPAIRDALGVMNFQAGPIAHALRQFAGVPIERRAEDEQAVVLHWFASLAAEHGADWRGIVASRLASLKSEADGRRSEVSEGRP